MTRFDKTLKRKDHRYTGHMELNFCQHSRNCYPRDMDFAQKICLRSGRLTVRNPPLQTAQLNQCQSCSYVNGKLALTRRITVPMTLCFGFLSIFVCVLVSLWIGEQTPED